MLKGNTLNSHFLTNNSGKVEINKREELVRFSLNSAYSKNNLERNVVSFHRCLSNSLRQAVALLIDKVLSKNIGEEVKITVKFKLIGIPSDRSIMPRGRISDNFRDDPSMRFKIVVFKPNVE
uniref:Uncharacterized protein n=1 Tax=viral metagenome TaxID=1070528 RepID=A0A2V0RAJ5_9ZZZZ